MDLYRMRWVMADLRQHRPISCCPIEANGTEPMSTPKKKERNEGSIIRSVYDLSTPLLDRYYRQMRKHIRFPRYYKKALNW